MWQWIKKWWGIIRSPAKYFSLGFLTLGGFIAGIIFWGAFNTGMELTNTEPFCVSCHENNVYQEIQGTIHFTNRTGVRAICSDCHVPHNWTDKMARKMQASKEVWAWITGAISTKEKFDARRLHMAEREWTRMKKNDSLECRNCHEFSYMDFTRQSSRASTQHSSSLADGSKTCIDCHKGIAHRLPNMSGVEGF
ncbi:NapC/NirT family cytochrome c [Photobacterium ganghwense]|uniref:Cytochrome c-type protein n=1 Tax=Photobacterium ganghwense TaxID=320778 RepID=A0A0J1K2E0_9GAMM|nr:NapC/NirT family cytochrome c [Photobacterium ganghwense]KLV08592.1 cytochrome C [Photobacterium ganghwense]MBV1839074.1 NapC/NirT family cytochrome c [Photobacterium ganghwense]PSU10707.1 cytochrome C [Photobacterium ganghwense]QSV12852.1 NapC/NirT family cytochrome c [Photobacterium ganghwense]